MRSIISPEVSNIEFSMKEPSWIGVQEVIISAKSASTPGQNGVL